MGRIAFVAYKPKPGKEEELKALMREHLPVLRWQGLVTDRESILMEAKDRTILEVFEWKSKEAIESAHANPVVGKLWERYAEVCDYIPVSNVPEVAEVFSEFAPFA